MSFSLSSFALMRHAHTAGWVLKAGDVVTYSLCLASSSSLPPPSLLPPFLRPFLSPPQSSSTLPPFSPPSCSPLSSAIPSPSYYLLLLFLSPPPPPSPHPPPPFFPFPSLLPLRFLFCFFRLRRHRRLRPEVILCG